MVGMRDETLLARMTAALRHRGPDGHGLWFGHDVGLGHRRLAVIDVSGGAQPMTSEDDHLVISYNGEIYNFRELRHRLEHDGLRFRTRSDTEVLLAAYRRWGDELVHELEGMFAFAIWDTRRRRLLLVRDPVGIKPLYYAQYAGQLVFASEPKALLEWPRVDRRLDDTALDAYLDLLYVPSPLSMFAGIMQVDPGHRIVWHDGQVEITQYWDAVPEPDVTRSLEAWAETVAPELERAICSHTVSDVPLGTFLSGGLDSSTIVAVLSERGHGPVETFCVGYGPEGRSYEERPMARVVAEHFGTRHHELEVSPDILQALGPTVRAFDEPFGNPTAVLSAELSRFARRSVTVALAGDGGDELFGGYPRYLGMLLSQRAQHVPTFVSKLASKLVPNEERSVARNYVRWTREFLDGLSLPAAGRYARWVGYNSEATRDDLLTSERREAVRKAGRRQWVIDAFTRPQRGDVVARATYADLHGFLPENILRLADRMSMAHGLELRVPFCDARLIRLLMRVPARHRVNMLASKRILRKIMRGKLPALVLRRSKLGFNPPVGTWLKGAKLVDEYLHPDIVERRGVVRPAAVARLRQEHDHGVRDHALRLWSLIVLEEWSRRYVDP